MKKKILSFVLAIAMILPNFIGVPTLFTNLFKNLFTIPAEAAFSETDFIDSPRDKDYAYTFAVVGDTQKLLWRDLEYQKNDFTNMYDWIVDQANDKKIDLVMGLGDITDANTGTYESAHGNLRFNGSTTSNNEYLYAKLGIDKLANANIPYTIVRGNHDKPSNTTTDDYTFDQYFKYDEYASRYSADQVGRYDGKYADGTMYNTYLKLEIQGHKYLILNIDCGVSSDYEKADDILIWANNIVSSNKDYQVIVNTHMYLDKDGDFFTLDESKLSQTNYYGLYHDGEILWEKLIKKHENIFLVLSGHVGSSDIGFSQFQGDHGNTISQFMIDPQHVDDSYAETTSYANAGAGMVALLHFSEDSNLVDVEYISTTRVLQGENAHYKSINQFSFNTTAETAADGFTISNGTITDYTGESSTLYIPSTINGEIVTAIGAQAFNGNTSIRNIVIPDTVTKIGQRAFNGCTNLRNVTLSNSLTLIDHHAFSACSSLKSIAIPSSVTEIKYLAFYSCKALTDVYMTAKIPTIGKGAFHCSGLINTWYSGTSSDKSNSVGKIDTGNYINSNGTDSGANNNYLLNSTWHYSKDYCTKNTLGDHFYFSECDSDCTYCEKIRTTTQSHTYTGICDRACDNCFAAKSNSTSHTYSGSCDIECNVCHDIFNTTTSHIYTNNCDESCNTCGTLRTPPHTFSNDCNTTCSGCNFVRRAPHWHMYSSCETCSNQAYNNFYFTIDDNDEATIVGYAGSSKTITIPNTITYNSQSFEVTAIGDYAFEGKTTITSVSIPTTVKYIGIRAFSGCTNLKTFPINSTHTNLKTIKPYAFYNCLNISNIYIPENVYLIGRSAFELCLSQKAGPVYISDSVELIEYHAFHITSECTSYEVGENNTNYHSANNCLIDTKTKTLIQAPNLSTVKIPYDGSVETIGEYSFYYRDNLEAVYIPSSVTTVKRYAFYGCSNPYNVYFEGSTQSEIVFEGNGHDNEKNGGILVPAFATWSYDKCMETGNEHQYTDNANCDTICDNCNKTTRTSDTEHTPGSWTIVTSATCVDAGLKQQKCSTCSTVIDSVSISPTGKHTYDENSCDPICNVCGYERDVEHDYTWEITTAPTCGKEGTQAYKCSICGTVSVSEAIPATGNHSFTNWIQTTDPTCTEKGEETRTCTVCSASETQEIDELGHEFEHACSETCKNCGEDNPNAVDHTYSEGCVDTQCDVCCNIRTAGEHTYDDCTDAICNKCIYERVAESEHNFGTNCTNTSCTNANCGATREAQEHAYDNACDTDCNNAGCTFTRVTSHTVNPDDVLDPFCTECGVYARADGYYDQYYDWSATNGEITITGYKGSETDIIIPSYINGMPVKVIGKKAFYQYGYDNDKNANNSTPITSLVIGEGIEIIEDSAFEMSDPNKFGDGIPEIYSLNIPESVTSIGYRAFYRWDYLTELSGCEGVITVGKEAFCLAQSGSNPTQTLPAFSKLKTIGDSSFKNWRGLKTLVISDSVETIGANAFHDCRTLEYLTIGKNVTTIGNLAFESRSLESISISFGNNYFKVDNDCLIEVSTQRLLVGAQKETIIIPNGVVTIDAEAFYGPGTKTSIVRTIIVSHGVKTIGAQAFDATAVGTLVLPSTITSFGNAIVANTPLHSEHLEQYSLGTVYFEGTEDEYKTYDFSNSNAALDPTQNSTKKYSVCIYRDSYKCTDDTKGYGHTFGGVCDTTCNNGNCTFEQETETVHGTFEWNKTSGNQQDPPVYICPNCNDVFATFKFKSASISLQQKLAINYKVNISELNAAGLEIEKVVFTFNGNEYTVLLADATDADGIATFTFKNIAPDQMTENLSAKLYAKNGDTEMTVTMEKYSIADYCYKKLRNEDNASNSQLLTLLVDTLNYGSMAQIYNNSTETLANAGLTDTEKKLGSTEYDEIKNETTQSGTANGVTWKAATLILKDTVTMKFKFKAEDVNGLTVKIKVGENEEYEADFQKYEGDVYQIVSNPLTALQMRENVKVTVYRDGEVASPILTYSIDAYVARKNNDATAETNLKNLIKAMMIYGDSAVEYKNQISAN